MMLSTTCRTYLYWKYGLTSRGTSFNVSGHPLWIMQTNLIIVGSSRQDSLIWFQFTLVFVMLAIWRLSVGSSIPLLRLTNLDIQSVMGTHLCVTYFTCICYYDNHNNQVLESWRGIIQTFFKQTDQRWMVSMNCEMPAKDVMMELLNNHDHGQKFPFDIGVPLLCICQSLRDENYWLAIL